MKFFILVEEELYYPSSENKGADQLCNCSADLRLCFCICAKASFLVSTLLKLAHAIHIEYFKN